MMSIFTNTIKAEAYNSTSGAIILEKTYRKKKAHQCLVDSSSDWH